MIILGIGCGIGMAGNPNGGFFAGLIIGILFSGLIGVGLNVSVLGRSKGNEE